MITMVKSGSMTIPAISSEEGLFDIDTVRDLRDALFTMLQVCLADDEVLTCIPSSQYYIVAVLLRELTHDLENFHYTEEQQEEPPAITSSPAH